MNSSADDHGSGRLRSFTGGRALNSCPAAVGPPGGNVVDGVRKASGRGATTLSYLDDAVARPGTRARILLGIEAYRSRSSCTMNSASSPAAGGLGSHQRAHKSASRPPRVASDSELRSTRPAPCVGGAGSCATAREGDHLLEGLAAPRAWAYQAIARRHVAAVARLQLPCRDPRARLGRRRRRCISRPTRIGGLDHWSVPRRSSGSSRHAVVRLRSAGLLDEAMPRGPERCRGWR